MAQQFLADIIDQLDLALDQAAVKDRNFDRFAMMLVDNVVELTLHRFAQDQASENSVWAGWRAPKNDPATVNRALSQQFDEKAKASCLLGLIDSEMKDSLLSLHQFRNTTYHNGERHESILHELSIFYIRCACEILIGYKPGWWSGGTRDVISHRAKKYLGEVSIFDGREKYQQAFQRLKAVAESMECNLISKLGSHLEKEISTVDEWIRCLSEDVPTPVSRDRVVVETQAWAFARTQKSQDFASAHGGPSPQSEEYVDWLIDNYRWPQHRDPISGWKRRCTNIQSETNPHAALVKYVSFIRQTQDLRDVIGEAVTEFDFWVQEQIDLARGK
ncbi:hypothetical protein [Alienimonas sp. DA493]|uniref:hypothetical protein n=1 Tax=Alienimonas sp. DA493 TaxID=3373605 RepID=UPI003754AA71